VEDATAVLNQLAAKLRGRYRHPDRVNLNYGVHFTGGEPFLRFGLLVKLTEIAHALGLPGLFVETNCFWCRDDETTREKLVQLKEAGLAGILISANPFVVEYIPFERIERAARLSEQVFGDNAIVYQRLFYDLFRQLGLKGTLPFNEFLRQAGHSLDYMELLPLGRASYKLSNLYRKYPARNFLGESCKAELIRDWHLHIDNYCNYVPGYCAGISLGDARNLDVLCQGINLDERPVLKALLSSMEELFRLGREYGYEEGDGYVSKCHLCLDIRRHLVKHGEFEGLQPAEFYERLLD